MADIGPISDADIGTALAKTSYTVDSMTLFSLPVVISTSFSSTRHSGICPRALLLFNPTPPAPPSPTVLQGGLTCQRSILYKPIVVLGI